MFGPNLPKAMRSAGSFMRSFNRVHGEYRSQFDQALRDVDRELGIKDIRNSVEAATKNSPTPVKFPPRQKEKGSDSPMSPDHTNRESGERTSKEVKEV